MRPKSVPFKLLFPVFFLFILQVRAEVPGWQVMGTPVSEKLNHVFFIDAQTGWIVGNNGVLLHTTDGGESWAQKSAPDSMNLLSVFFLDGSVGFLAGYQPTSSALFKTTDGANSWQMVFQLPAGTVINRVTVDATGKIWLGGEGADVLGDPYGFLYASPDTGTTWNSVLNNSSSLAGVQDICFGGSNFGFTVNCSLVSFTYYVPQVWYTLNNGQSWQLAIIPDSGYVIAPRYLRGAFAGTQTAYLLGRLEPETKTLLRKSTDGGQSWIIVADSLPGNPYLEDLAFVSPDTGWLVGQNIIRTVDGGVSWQQQWEGNSGCLLDVFFLNNEKGWAVGENGLALRTTTGGVTDIGGESQSLQPLDVWLYPNYPNPFNPETRISFTLRTSLTVRLEILDTQGRRVSVLVNKTLSAGEYTYEWNAAETGRELSTGLYFVRLKAGRQQQVRKILYLK